METVLIVFMILVCLVCTFAVLVAVWEIMQERKEKKSSAESVATEEKVEKPQPPKDAAAAVAVVEIQPEKNSENEEKPLSEEEGGVSFAAVEKSKTLSEKYNELSEIYKSYYDEVANYASCKQQVKCIKNNSYEEYKFYHASLVRLQIKNGLVVCQYFLANTEFQSYINDNKVKVKMSPTVLKITGNEALEAAKNSVDIAYEAAVNERERKIRLRREKSKQARDAKKQAEAQSNGN